MMYSAMMVTFDCNSPTQKPSGACVVRKKCRDRSIASVTRLIHSPELEASGTIAESGCVAMGDLLHVVGPGTSMCFFNLPATADKPLHSSTEASRKPLLTPKTLRVSWPEVQEHIPCTGTDCQGNSGRCRVLNPATQTSAGPLLHQSRRQQGELPRRVNLVRVRSL
jgi:hypothetical protein